MAKGVSKEEKRKRLLECFHTTKSVYNLKEVEKMGVQKGIVEKTVKEVLQELVDDNLIDAEKIGSSNYYWSFPSKVYKKKENQLIQIENEKEELKKKIEKNEKSIKKLLSKFEDAEEREQLSKEIKEGTVLVESLREEFEIYKDNDPVTIKNKEKMIQVAFDSANRWTDNIFNIKDWSKSKFNIDEQTINKHFGLNPELDYITFT